MPEGHTIHRLARDVGRDLVGEEIGAETRQERFANSARRLDGRMLTETSAWGKHLFLHFDDDILHVHLGLVGKFLRHVVPFGAPSPALRVRLSGPTAAWDLTGPMICTLREPEVIDEVASKLGPDPLRRDADPERFFQRVRTSKKPIGALLLDQAVIAGVGNVYRAEILHLTGTHPERVGRSLDEDEIRAIWDTSVAQLRLGSKRNRIVTVPLAGRAAARIPRDEAVHVYKQEHCRTCGGPIELAEIGSRNSFACPRCQPRRKPRRQPGRQAG